MKLTPVAVVASVEVEAQALVAVGAQAKRFRSCGR